MMQVPSSIAIVSDAARQRIKEANDTLAVMYNGKLVTITCPRYNGQLIGRSHKKLAGRVARIKDASLDPFKCVPYLTLELQDLRDPSKFMRLDDPILFEGVELV